MREGAAVYADPFIEELGEFFAARPLVAAARRTRNSAVRATLKESLRIFDEDVRRSTASERYEMLLSENANLAGLSPRWDGYSESAPPTPQSIMLADEAIRISFAFKQLPTSVMVSAEGGVAVCWDMNGKHAYIEFNNDETAVTARYFDTGRPFVLEFDPSDRDTLRAQIRSVGLFLK